VKAAARTAIASLFLGAIAVAQPPGATPPMGPPGQAQLTPAQQKRERIKKRIRALRAYTITEELQLDGATAEKLFPVLAHYDDELDKLLVARAQIQKQLTAVASGRDPRAADRAVEDAIANQRAFWQMQDKRLDDLRKILSPQQTARLLVVLPPLERKIENQLRQAVQGAQGGGKAQQRDDFDDGDAPPRPRRPAPVE
jgi:hypothetical protein